MVAVLPSSPASASSRIIKLRPLGPKDDISTGRAWQSRPHPTQPLLATARDKDVIIYSLTTGEEQSRLTKGHSRSVRSVAWKPDTPPNQLCLASGSFDATAGIWQTNQGILETQVFSGNKNNNNNTNDYGVSDDDDYDDDREEDGPWDLEIVLEGHDSEIKSLDFSPSGQYLATCSRDKTVWIWEHVGVDADDEEWECVAVLNEHDGDVKSVAWCPMPSSTDEQQSNRGRYYSSDVLASASYDDTVRIWREDSDNEWVCVAVLEGHEGTVWGVQWESPRAAADGGSGFPRLLTWSADKTIRVWTMKVEDEEEEEEAPQPSHHAWSGLGGGIPNTMRRSLKEEWECTAILPRAHTRDVYSASWSAQSGLVASTGSDSIVAIYREEEQEEGQQDLEIDAAGEMSTTTAAAAAAADLTEQQAAAELDGEDVVMTNGGQKNKKQQQKKKKNWTLVSSTPNGHGPYEINHIVWCKRYDDSQNKKKEGEGDEEEMLVTTGDDGTIYSWEVRL